MESVEKKIKHVYLLTGEETFYIDKAREKILSRLEIDRADLISIDCDEKPSIGEIVSAIDSAPFFNPKNVVVVKNAAPIFNSENKSERLPEILKDMQESNFVIFISNAVDKRKKLYKIISEVGDVLEADALRSWQIDDWLNEKLKSLGKVMYGEARKHFSERIGLLPEISLWYLDNELNKVALTVNNNEITAADLRRAMTTPPEVSNFALTDAIDEKKSKKAVYILRAQLRDNGKMPLVIAMLTKHVRQLLRAKFFIKKGITGKRLGEPLELNPFIAQKVGANSAGYPSALLEEVFIELADADYKLKTGRAGAEVLEKIVIKLCRR